MSALHLLRKWFLLLERLASQSLHVGHLFGPVEVVLHVGDLADEGGVFAYSTTLRWVGQDVSWANHDSAIVLSISEVLNDLLVVFHMRVSSVSRLSNVLCWPEGLLVADLNLPRSVLLADERASCLLERIADRGVRWSHEESLITLTPLRHTNIDVTWVNDDFFHVRVRVQASCINVKGSIMKLGSFT